MILGVGPGTPASIASAVQRSGAQATTSSPFARRRQGHSHNDYFDDASDLDDEDDESSSDDDDGSSRHRLSHPQMRPMSIDPPTIDLPTIPTHETPSNWSPALRHSGCINTACWLSDTQVMTSGDDRLIKVWDVSNSLGSTSPISGGWDTFAPFANAPDPRHHSTERIESLTAGSQHPLPGSVRLLQTFVSGHRGNVFHITPCYGNTKILSSAADGYLRLIDREMQTSSVVIDPDDIVVPVGHHRSDMAFCHQQLTFHTGLFCSVKGLVHFDLRAPARSHQCLVHEPCKAVAPLSMRRELHETIESNQVFFGGLTPVVKLLDLRLNGEQGVLRRFCMEEALQDGVDGVSVSGLDISKDGKDLLVSYESDQIYTFPIRRDEQTRSITPTGVQMHGIPSDSYTVDHEAHFLPKKCYGGHLNRLTFLKSAKFSGPNDDYIVTGSDSGHAWFFHRESGRVAGLLAADTRTCNGVVPHPTLPVFVSYGIGRTAKLWRAAPCAARTSDDSPSGRYKSYLKASRHRKLSPVASSWTTVKYLVAAYQPDIPSFLPDVASLSTVANDFTHGPGHIRGADSPLLGNGFLSLPDVLFRNKSDFCKTDRLGFDKVIAAQNLLEFSRIATGHRMKHQADSLGVRFNGALPWALQCRRTEVHTADLIPDYPSDWIMSDPWMARITQNDESGTTETKSTTFPPWLPESDWKDVSLLSSKDEEMCYACSLILKTAIVAKEGGNEAMKEADTLKKTEESEKIANLMSIAARRYDKALQYCAVLFLHHCEPLEDFQANSAIWNPLPAKKALVAVKLNLTLVLLRTAQYAEAKSNAMEALDQLSQEPHLSTEDTTGLTAKAHYRLGCVLLQLGQLDAAENRFKSSMELKPDAVVRRRFEEVIRLKKRKRIRKHGSGDTS